MEPVLCLAIRTGPHLLAAVTREPTTLTRKDTYVAPSTALSYLLPRCMVIILVPNNQAGRCSLVQ